ncbi:MAG: hypothetical protein ABW221_06100 [Vicinamibacteria bacterium]
MFRYEGSRGLLVIGRFTGRRYWFERYGSEVAIDPRDRPSVVQVPLLRAVRSA